MLVIDGSVLTRILAMSGRASSMWRILSVPRPVHVASKTTGSRTGLACVDMTPRVIAMLWNAFYDPLQVGDIGL